MSVWPPGSNESSLGRLRHEVLYTPAGGALAQLVHLFPIGFDRRPAGIAQPHEGLGLLLDEALFDLDQPRLFELRKVRGEVAFGEAGDALQEEEVGLLARRERGQDGQAGRIVDPPVQIRELLERSGVHRWPPSARTSWRRSRSPASTIAEPQRSSITQV